MSTEAEGKKFAEELSSAIQTVAAMRAESAEKNASFVPQIARPNYPQGLGYEPIDSEHILACERAPLTDWESILPARWLVAIEKNHPSPCCKDKNNLDIEAWWSKQEVKDQGPEPGKGPPDLYKFYCNVCGVCHARLCVGQGHHPLSKNWTEKKDPAFSPKARPELYDFRPMWHIG